jgi:DNA primase
VAVQPDGLDPCDLRIRQGDAAVRDLVASRLPLFEFAVRSAIQQHDLDTAEGRLAALDAAAPVVADIKDRALRQMYAVSLDRWLGIMDEQFVLNRVRELAARRGNVPPNGRGRAPNGRQDAQRQPPAEAERPSFDPNDPDVRRERELLKLAVQRPALLGPEFDQVPAGAFIAPPHVAVREVIGAAGGVTAAGGSAEWVARLLEQCPNDQVRALVTQFGVEQVHAAQESDDRYAVELLARIQERQLTRLITELKSKLQRLNPAEQAEEYNRVFGDLVAYEQQRRVLRERGLGSQ